MLCPKANNIQQENHFVEMDALCVSDLHNKFSAIRAV